MICNHQNFHYLCKKIKDMKNEYTIEELAGFRINNLISCLKPDDNRWFEIVSFRGWNEDFQVWLKENDFERIPRYAKKFISKREKELYGKQDWDNFVKSSIELENILHHTNFWLLLEKRLKEYKDNPYEGQLRIGHFVGIKKNINDNPYEYKDHVVGQIEDYKEEPDGHISTYVLSKDDNTEVTLPVEMTYRVY